MDRTIHIESGEQLIYERTIHFELLYGQYGPLLTRLQLLYAPYGPFLSRLPLLYGPYGPLLNSVTAPLWTVRYIFFFPGMLTIYYPNPNPIQSQIYIH